MPPALPRRTAARSLTKRSGGDTLQAQKSAQTRKALIEATIRCIIKYGYADTTTPRVAAEAGLSRGAMLHHFENGPALIRAAIAYLHEKRLRAFKRSVSALPAGDHHRMALRTYWQQVTHPMSIAFYELVLAARTDMALAEILLPAQQEFQAQWNALAVDLFPDWQKDRHKFELALALCQNTLEGMAINRMSKNLSDEMVEQLLIYLEDQLRTLNPAKPQANAPKASAA